MAPDLESLAKEAREQYADLLAAGQPPAHWWTAVVITASSARQAERYEEELTRRRQRGQLPAGVLTLAVPDLDDQRLGSGGATINALQVLYEQAAPDAPLGQWWRSQRVLLIHAGGDSRRLPQYSLSGKLFSALPTGSTWGGTSTLFDEFLALSTSWAQRLDTGLAVASGDVLLTLDAAALNWRERGVSGVAMLEPHEVGAKHGVYVLNPEGRVYAFLQKPTWAQVGAVGGLFDDDCVAVDTGLLYFDPPVAARLTSLAPSLREASQRPVIDLYQHFTLALTGEYRPGPEAPPALRELASALHGTPFRCDLVAGDFTHIGTTRLFRQLLAEQTSYSRVYESRQRLQPAPSAGLQSGGIVLDSVLSGGGELGTGAVAIECHLQGPVALGSGAIAHGLTDLPGKVEIPANVVAHQVPVLLDDGRSGTVIRVYGVEDDPKQPLLGGACTWQERPVLELLAHLKLDPELVWEGVEKADRTLWNARLFPLGSLREVWDCARWQMGLSDEFDAARWAALPRLSLAESAHWADSRALSEARARRLEAQWEATAVTLAEEGADIRPLLANAPALVPVASAGRTLARQAQHLSASDPSTAASRYLQANMLLGHAGLAEEAARAHEQAFASVRQAVDAAEYANPFAGLERQWVAGEVTALAPARVDLAGGWSDTPPFCLDWGGTVLNLALLVDGEYPIRAQVKRLPEPLIRCISEDCGEVVEYTTAAEVLAPPGPGDASAIPRAALAMAGLVRADDDLPVMLAACGGGLQITTNVSLPLGSGLGTSSILIAAVLAALAEMAGVPLPPDQLAEQVLRLEQFMTTGGGWQDQAGAIFPGAKLIHSGPGLTQRLRVTPVSWSPERQAEFAERFVLYDTGLQRVARGLLGQVVSRYLARELTTVQVLHSIKTLAWEMAHALGEGQWRYLGQLLDRHWELNQQLVPGTTNAPIEALLHDVRPYLTGAKLAGAGGGGFMLLMTEMPEQAQALRAHLRGRSEPGRLREWQLAERGLHVVVK